MSSKKYYVVWTGKKPGIYTSWDEAKVQITGFPGAQFKSYKDYNEAKLAFNSNKNQPNSKIFDANSIAVDAACSGNPGVMEYRGVETATAKEIFKMGPFQQGTNNVGEFLAIVHAAAMLKKSSKNDVIIYTDSLTALSWVRNKNPKTTLERTKENEPLWELIERASAWLHQNTILNPIVKWPTHDWGEIPADFGRK